MAFDGSDKQLSERTVTGAFWMIAWRMVTRVLGLGSTLVLARILVPADFGLVAMATVLAGAIDSISLIGLQDALIRRTEHDDALFNPAFSMQVVRGFATAVVTAAAAWPASIWFNEPRLFPVILVLAGAAAAAGFENIAIIEFRRNMRFDVEFRLLFLPRISQVVVTVVLALLLKSYWALIAGIVIGKLARVVMTYVIHPYRPRFTMHRWRELILFSFWTWMSGMASMVWDRSDAIIVGPVLGPALLGAYVLAEEIAILPITELVAPAAAALYAGIARKRDGGGGTIHMAFPIISFLLMLITPMSIGLSASSGYWVAALLGAKWFGTHTLISIFTLACIFAPVSYVCTTTLLAEGHVRQNFSVVAMSAVFKIIVLSAATMVTHRPEIIAFVAICTNFIEATLFVLQLRRLDDTQWRTALGGLSRTAVSSAVTVAALYFSGFAWTMPTTIHVIPALFMGCAVGLAALILFAIVQFALWTIAGRPEGPESRARLTLTPMLDRQMARFQRGV